MTFPKRYDTKVSLKPVVILIDSPTYIVAKYLATILRNYTEKTSCLEPLSLRQFNLDFDHDLLVSFDVISLSTEILNCGFIITIVQGYYIKTTNLQIL